MPPSASQSKRKIVPFNYNVGLAIFFEIPRKISFSIIELL